jgi:crossover junction endodeoxyribonuclease RuvC
LRVTGWALIDSAGSRLVWIADGVIRSTDDGDLSSRLAELHQGIAGVIESHRPDAVAIEETFVNKNPASTLKLAQARGAILTAAGLAGLALAEYAPNRVKKSVVGSGHATKDQIGLMVRRLLPGCLAASPDAADALAVAICHAHYSGLSRYLVQTKSPAALEAMR